MQENQDLTFLTTTILQKMRAVLINTRPSLILVQGDTTTAFAATLASFYAQIPVGHVEAGLRSGNIKSPFPEEFNRACITKMASIHFTPTAQSTANLLAEKVNRESIFRTGNTVVDSLFLIKEKLKREPDIINNSLKLKINECNKLNRKIVLLTTHRRESFDGGITSILRSVKKFAQAHPDVHIFYPIHPNPHVTKAIEIAEIATIDNIQLLQPLLYHELVFLLTACSWVITDSGGIQEEAVSLGKQTLS